MTEKQKQGVKQAARDFYRDRRITLETAEWLELEEAEGKDE
jgi:hypothetical protein